MFKYLAVALCGTISATDLGPIVGIRGSVVPENEGASCKISIPDASGANIEYVFTDSDSEVSCRPLRVFFDLSGIIPNGLEEKLKSYSSEIRYPGIAFTRTSGEGSWHVLTCWTWERVLGVYSFEDAELTSLVGAGATQAEIGQLYLPVYTSHTQGAPSAQSMMDGKCSQIVQMRHSLIPQLGGIYSGFVGERAGDSIPLVNPPAGESAAGPFTGPSAPSADAGRSEDSRATNPFPGASVLPVNEGHDEDVGHPSAVATAPSLMGAVELHRMIPMVAGEERIGEARFFRGQLSIKVESIGQCGYSFTEPLPEFVDMKDIHPVTRSLTGIDMLMPGGALCVNFSAPTSRLGECSGCAERIDFTGSQVQCRRPGDSRPAVTYDFPGMPLSEPYNEIMQDYSAHKAKVAGNPLRAIFSMRSAADFEDELYEERGRIQIILNEVCGFILQSVWPVIRASIDPQVLAVYEAAGRALAQVRARVQAARVAEQERLEGIRIARLKAEEAERDRRERMRIAEREARRAREILNVETIARSFKDRHVMVPLNEGDELTVRRGGRGLENRLWVHTRDCGISMSVFDPDDINPRQLPLIRRILAQFAGACVSPSYVSDEWAGSEVSLSPGPDTGTKISTFLDRPNAGDRRIFRYLVCRPARRFPDFFSTYRFVYDSENDPFVASSSADFGYIGKIPPKPSDDVWMWNKTEVLAKSLCAGVLRLQIMLSDILAR